MADLQAEILGEIKIAIADIDEDKASQLTQYLLGPEVGVRSVDSLFDVSVDIIASKVSHCDANKLHRTWQQKFRPGRARILQDDSIFTYRVKWETIPQNIVQQLEAGEWLDKNDRCLLNRLVVLDVIAEIKGMKRENFTKVAESMVKKYSLSLGDRVGLEATKKFSYLSHKLKCRFDEEVRPIKCRNEAPSFPEAHGCVRWRVYISKEKREELVIKKEKMIETYNTTLRKEWPWENLLVTLDETFPIQREDINGQTKKRKKSNAALEEEEERKTTTQIAKEWPFLFQSQGMLQHFKTLTGKDWTEQVKQFDEKYKVKDFIEFLSTLKELKDSTIKKTLQRALKEKLEDVELMAFVLMLLEYFHEERESILKTVDITTALNEADDATEIPPTPCIISQGPAFRAKKFYFSVDGHVLCSAKCFSDSLALFFCSYFILNIKYPENASNTLDFLQRVVAGIDPDRGSKSTKKSKKGSKSERVQTLIDKHATWVRHRSEEAGGPGNEDDDGLL